MSTFKEKLRKAASGDRMKQNLIGGALLPLTYVGVPTLLKLEGWMGLLVGALGSWLTGVALDNPALQAMAFGAATVHLTYSYGTDAIKKITGGRAPWNFGTGSNMNDYLLAGLANGTMVPVKVGNDTVMRYNTPTDLLPAPGQSQAMQDYMNNDFAETGQYSIDDPMAYDPAEKFSEDFDEELIYD